MTTPETRRRTVTSGGVPLAVFSSGDPARPTVLLVHGYPDTHRVWDTVCRELAADFHVVRYDVRGAGRSGCPADLAGYLLDRLADDLFAVAAAVSPDRPVHVAGHDWGSIQAWHAATDARAAGRISSFTSISGPCLDHAGFWFRRRLARPTPRHAAQLIGQCRRSWYIAFFQLPLVAPFGWRRFLAARWDRYLRTSENILPIPGFPEASLPDDAVRGIALYRANMRPHIRRPRPRHAVIPVQVITPTRDRYVGAALAAGPDLDQWTARLSRQTIDATHWSVLTRNAPTVAEMIRQFAAGAEHGSGTSRTTQEAPHE
jgi:pimeloyl-ACP methyl ester carboxylesterase